MPSEASADCHLSGSLLDARHLPKFRVPAPGAVAGGLLLLISLLALWLPKPPETPARLPLQEAALPVTDAAIEGEGAWHPLVTDDYRSHLTSPPMLLPEPTLTEQRHR
jgi:hypothetical protein